jgi:GxxExxY protein
MELTSCGVPFEPQKEFALSYKGVALPKTFRADIVCYGKIILELKAVKALLPEHEAQLINYLRVSNLKMGLLVNFHSAEKLDVKTYVNPRAQE